MKKIFLFCLLMLTALVYADEVKRVAILEVVDREGKLSYSQKLMLRSNLARAVTNTKGFEAYDRTDMDAIFSEHDFQRSGNVSDSQIKKLGEMTGASYILVAEGVLAEAGKLFVTAKILNVESAKVEVTENMLMGTASSAMQYGCRDLAKKMFSSLNNPFVSAYKNKEDSIAAAKKAEQRAQEQRIREERAAAEAKARKEREDAMYAVREQKRLEQERKKAEEEERAKYYITRLNSNEYLYLSNTMSRKEYENFLKNNCAEAFSQYRRGKKHIIAGWTLFGVGLAAGVSGIVYGTLSGNQTTISSSQSTTTSYDGTTYSSTTSQSSFKFNVVGSILAATGSGLVIASIPTLAVGYSKRNKAYTVYNNQCASPTISPLSLNLTAGQNGLGLALQF